METMGFHRATSLPCGVSGRTGQLCEMSQSSSFLRMLLGAEAAEVEFIPPICVVCNYIPGSGVSELWDSLV